MMKLNLSVWGCRGSFPLIGAVSAYGIQTSCFTLESERALYILDAGSGLRIFLRDYENKSGTDRKPVHLFLSHLHHDHVSGLFDCQSLAAVSEEIHIYGPAGQNSSLKNELDRLIGPPYWPLPFSELCAGKVIYHDLLPGMKIAAGDLCVSTAAAPHPDGCLWYRFEAAYTEREAVCPGSSGGALSGTPLRSGFLYGLDGELKEEVFPELGGFAAGAGTAILDAQFSPEELPLREGWGHASYIECLRLAEAADIKNVLLSHFSPAYSDEELDEMSSAAASVSDRAVFVREGMQIELYL